MKKEVSNDVLLNKIENIEADVKDIKQKLDSEYATKEWVNSNYGQTKKTVDGIIALVLLAVVGALVGLVIIK